MVKRSSDEGNSSTTDGGAQNERVTTEVMAGNLVGYQLLKMVHNHDIPNYEELSAKEINLLKIREMAENLNIHESTANSEPRPSEAHQSIISSTQDIQEFGGAVLIET